MAVAGAITGALLPAILFGLIPALYAMAIAAAAAMLPLLPWILGGIALGALIGGILWIIQNWTMLKQKAMEIWQAIVGALQGYAKNLTDAWNNLWSGMTSTVGKAWDAVMQTIKNSINWIIEKINFVINQVNSIASKISGTVGAKAPQIPTIPMLAEGGIVNRPTLAMIGEAGAEAVIPLSKMAGAGIGGINIYISGNEFLGEEGIADKIGAQIMQAIRRNIKL